MRGHPVSPSWQRLLTDVETAARGRAGSGESSPLEDFLHGVPHGGSDVLGGGSGVDDVRGALAQDVDGVVVLAEGLGRAHLVDDEQVATLARQLPPAVLEDGGLVVAGLGGEADDDGEAWSARVATSSARMSGLRIRAMVGAASGSAGSWLFLIWLTAYSAGRKSATAAAMTTTSADFPASSTASRISVAVLPGMTVTPDGAQVGVGADENDLGAALGGHRRERVALLSGGPVAQETHRVERFAGAAGRDHHPPARQRQRRRHGVLLYAASSGGRPGREVAMGQHPLAHGIRSSGSGRRPGPVSAPVRRPEAGG